MQYPKNSYYKYRALYLNKENKQVNQFTQAIVEKSGIYYATPATLNDPFDCNLKLHVDDSNEEQWIEYINKLIDAHPQDKQLLNDVKNNELWKQCSELKNVGVEMCKKIYLDSSVFCLSKKKNSIPMFSHYADEHKGIAIEFKFSDTEIPCGFPCGDLTLPDELYQRKVTCESIQYLSHFPDLNYHRLHESSQLVTNLMFTKFLEWSHEEEFRIFRRGTPSSIVSFDPSLLTRIIFGSRTDSQDIDLIKKWLKQHPSRVVLAKAIPEDRAFELRIEDFDAHEPS